MYKQITRKEWIIALKSGEYKQSKGLLVATDDEDVLIGYCCLGVACTLAGVSIDKMQEYNTSTYIFTDFNITSLGLSEVVNEDDLPSAARLAELNDQGYSFEQIADLLIFDSYMRGIE